MLKRIDISQYLIKEKLSNDNDNKFTFNSPHITFLSHQSQSDEHYVVIKEFPYISTNQFSNLAHNVELINSISHYCIAHIKGFYEGTQKIPPSLICTFYPFRSVKDLIQSIKTSEKISIYQTFNGTHFMKICYGVAYAMNLMHLHSPPYIHRDLRTSTVLLNADYDPFVSGYGISDVNSCSKYVAPEIKSDTKQNSFIDPRSLPSCDIFAYGVFLEELLDAYLVSIKNYMNNQLPCFTSLIQQCKSINPDSRPKFADILLSFDRNGFVSSLKNLPNSGFNEDEYKNYCKKLSRPPPRNGFVESEIDTVLKKANPFLSQQTQQPPEMKAKLKKMNLFSKFFIQDDPIRDFNHDNQTQMNTKVKQFPPQNKSMMYPGKVASNILTSQQKNRMAMMDQSFPDPNQQCQQPQHTFQSHPMNPYYITDNYDISNASGDQSKKSFLSSKSASDSQNDFNEFDQLVNNNNNDNSIINLNNSRLHSINKNFQINSETRLLGNSFLNGKNSFSNRSVNDIYEEALHNDKGDTVYLNIIRAAKLFKEAADRGHVESMHKIGMMLYKGLGIRADIKEAIKYFQKSWNEARKCESASQLAEIYLTNQQFRNVEEGEKYLKESLKGNDLYGNYLVVKLFVENNKHHYFYCSDKNKNIESAALDATISLRFCLRKEYRLFSPIFIEFAKIAPKSFFDNLERDSKSEPAAMFYLGMLYHQGILSNPSPSRAISLLENSFLKNFRSAFDYFVSNNLTINSPSSSSQKGLYYIIKGAKIAKSGGSEVEAFSYLKSGAESSKWAPDFGTLQTLAMAMKNGLLDTKPVIDLISFYADNGSSPAKEVLGLIYTKGINVDKNDSKGLYYLKLAFDDENYKMCNYNFLRYNFPGFYYEPSS